MLVSMLRLNSLRYLANAVAIISRIIGGVLKHLFPQHGEHWVSLRQLPAHGLAINVMHCSCFLAAAAGHHLIVNLLEVERANIELLCCAIIAAALRDCGGVVI
jgi:hypothetical protein